MKTRHVVALVIGCLLLLPGLGMLLGGAVAGAVSIAVRDSDGWYSVTLDRLESAGVAVTAEDLVVELNAPTAVTEFFDLEMRLTARPVDGTTPIFLGVASTADLDDYFRGAAHDQVISVDRDGTVRYSTMPGNAAVAPPGDQQIWDARGAATGTGTDELGLTWTAHTGRWSVAVLNADGSAGVAVAATAAARSGAIVPIIFFVAALGLLLTVLGTAVVIIAVRGRGREDRLPPPSGTHASDSYPNDSYPGGTNPNRTRPHDPHPDNTYPNDTYPNDTSTGGTYPYGAYADQPGAGATVPSPDPTRDRASAYGPPPGPAAYGVTMPTIDDPVTLEARLAPDLSRGLWLVKWFLAIPHYVVLAFLWLAFLVLSVCAWFAILVTGRYPRSIFDFNVGVLRWTWRVAYYAGNGGLGTDRYPPFTLDPTPEDDARLDIAYPGELSRGLVLVKWLLLVPHWIVLGILIGSALTSENLDSEVWQGPTWPGLLGVIALVAGLVLLFSGTYAKGLFDVIIGLNRWVYRVVAYGALMTDVYPPFRLDQGGTTVPRADGPGGGGSRGSGGGSGMGFGRGFGGDTDRARSGRAGAAAGR